MNTTNRDPLTEEQLDLIDRFVAAYNAIDDYLREKLYHEKSTPFSQLVRGYAALNPRWGEQDFLLKIGDLRNVVVHQRGRSNEYLSVPMLSVVENLERIRNQFKAPKRLFPKFAREVICFQTQAMLSDVLR